MYEKRLKQIASDYSARGLTLVAINPYDPRTLRLSEMSHSDVGESLPEMKIRAQFREFNFPYLSDGATQRTSARYAPTALPQIFLFDRERKLRYQGRLDDNMREELATQHEARDAVEALLAGQAVRVASAPAIGCAIKWSDREKGARDDLTSPESDPVSVELTSADKLKLLRRNGSGNLLLVNFWATWCAPCVTEFPELQKIVRMYRERSLHVVTVSVNSPEERSIVEQFLKTQHAINTNLLWNTHEPADALSAFAAMWNGGIPYTVLLGMNGELLYRSQGSMDPLQVKRAILRNLPDDRYIGQRAYWASTF
jgi:thiol-disulfide isomerase/thioredoxin